jgi:hypothetical protein
MGRLVELELLATAYKHTLNAEQPRRDVLLRLGVEIQGELHLRRI